MEDEAALVHHSALPTPGPPERSAPFPHEDAAAGPRWVLPSAARAGASQTFGGRQAPPQGRSGPMGAHGHTELLEQKGVKRAGLLTGTGCRSPCHMFDDDRCASERRRPPELHQASAVCWWFCLCRAYAAAAAPTCWPPKANLSCR